MNCLTELPEGYSEIFKVDLQKDKKMALLINVLGFVIMIVMFCIGVLFVPISTLFDIQNDFGRLVLMSVGLILYMVLHELVHGICMKYFGTPKVNYGFTGLYAYAGSNAYFTKKPYIIIALAPVVVWGIVLLVINLFVDASWFWCVYFIQICNISGAVGDIYVTYKFSKMPKDILVQDIGVSMTVYSACK